MGPGHTSADYECAAGPDLLLLGVQLPLPVRQCNSHPILQMK